VSAALACGSLSLSRSGFAFVRSLGSGVRLRLTLPSLPRLAARRVRRFAALTFASLVGSAVRFAHISLACLGLGPRRFSSLLARSGSPFTSFTLARLARDRRSAAGPLATRSLVRHCRCCHHKSTITGLRRPSGGQRFAAAPRAGCSRQSRFGHTPAPHENGRH